MHYVSIEVTGKHHLINLFRNTSIICLLHLYSRLDNMDGFHLPGDPYFPNPGNGGWLEAELEEDNLVVPVEEEPEESSEQENEEEVQEDSDSELDVYNPPQVA